MAGRINSGALILAGTKSIGRIKYIKRNASSDRIYNLSILDQRKKGRKLPACCIVAHVMLAMDNNSQVFSSPPAGVKSCGAHRPTAAIKWMG